MTQLHPDHDPISRGVVVIVSRFVLVRPTRLNVSHSSSGHSPLSPGGQTSVSMHWDATRSHHQFTRARRPETILNVSSPRATATKGRKRESGIGDYRVFANC